MRTVNNLNNPAGTETFVHQQHNVALNLDPRTQGLMPYRSTT